MVRVMQGCGSCSIRVDERQATEVGFVQAHTASYTFTDGGQAEVQAAMLARVDGEGRVTRVDEYLDSGALAPLIAAVSAALGESAGSV